MKAEALSLGKQGLAWGVFFCALFSSAAIIKVWPPLDGDAPAYFPSALEISEGRPLKTPVWLSPYPSTLEPFKENRFVGHGFVYQMVVGGIGWLFGGGARATVAGMYLLNLAASYLVGRGLLLWAPDALRSSFLAGAVIGIAHFALCMAWPGRMEPGVFFLMGLALMAAKPDTKRSWFFLGAITACLGLVSPVYGAGGGLLLGIRIFLGDGKSPATAAMYASGGGLFAVCLAFLVYPYPITAWVSGVLTSSSGVLSRQVGQGFINTWVKNHSLPGLILIYAVYGGVVLLAIGDLLQKRKNLKILGKSLCVTFTVLFVVFIFRMAVAKSEAAYNAIGWIPLLLAVLYSTQRNIRFLLFATWLLGLPILGLIRGGVILANQFTGEAVGFEELQSEIQSKQKQGVLVTPVFFLACVDPWNVEFDDTREKRGPKPRWFIDKQINRGIESPLRYPGFRLVKNRFGPAIKFLGVPVTRTPGGWNYAVYQKEN